MSVSSPRLSPSPSFVTGSFIPSHAPPFVGRSKVTLVHNKEYQIKTAGAQDATSRVPAPVLPFRRVEVALGLVEVRLGLK